MGIVKFTLNRIWYAIAMLVMGILLIVGGVNAANSIMSVIVTVIGGLAIVFGVFSIVAHQIGFGVAEIVIGALLISFAWTIAWVAFLVMGAMMIVYGVIGLIGRHGPRKILSDVVSLLCGVLIILVGCGCGWAWSFANVFFYVAGAFMIVDSILTLAMF